MQNNFDNINNKSIQPFIDFETAWAGLKPELDAEAKRREKRKRRFIIFWFLLAAIGLGGGLFMVNGDDKVENGKLKVENKNKNGEATSIEKNIANYKQSNIEHTLLNTTNTTNNDDLNNSAKTNISSTKHKVLASNTKAIASNTETIASNTKAIASNTKTIASNANAIASNTKTIASNTKALASNTKTIASNTKAIASNTKAIASNTKTIASNTKVAEPKDNSLTKNEVITTQQSNNQLQTPNSKQEINAKQETKQQIKNQKSAKGYSYGLQWNVPVLDGVNYFDINTVKQPATLLVPTAWVSKQFGKKHSVELRLNPYSQYFVNNRAIISNDIYTIQIQSGSQINNKPNDIVYSETVSFNKLIAIEASLLYHYQLANKIKLGIGISNNWLQGALLQNKIVKNYQFVTRDSLFGINKSDKEWTNLQSTFMLGKLEMQYQLKKFDVGVSFSKPIGNVFSSNVQDKTPVNTNLFLRWKIK
jgi:hypothetical protein